jgi:hypothetical protein
VQLRPRDEGAFFNWGNTLYRHARLVQKLGNVNQAHHLLIEVPPTQINCHNNNNNNNNI